MHRWSLIGALSLAVALLSPAVMASGVVSNPAASENELGTKQALRRWVDDGWDKFNKALAGTVETEVTPVHYRMSTKSFKTNFRYGIVDAETQLGYGGRLKLETRWPSLGGNMSINIAAESDNAAAYLFQYKRQF
jgi:hypothetical protein